MKRKKKWIPIMLFCIFVVGSVSLPFYMQHRDNVEKYQDLIEKMPQMFEDKDGYTCVYIKSKEYIIYPIVKAPVYEGLCLIDLSDCDLKEKIVCLQIYGRHSERQLKWMNDYIPYVIYNYEMYGGKEIIIGTKNRPIFPPILE